MLVLAALLAENAPQPMLRADPPGGALGNRLTSRAGLLDEVAVAELRIIAMGVEQRVTPIGLGEFGVGHRVGPPTGSRAGEQA